MVAFTRPVDWNRLCVFAPGEPLALLRPDLEEAVAGDEWKQGRPCSISSRSRDGKHWVIIAWSDKGDQVASDADCIEVEVQFLNDDYFRCDMQAALKAVELYHAQVEPYR